LERARNAIIEGHFPEFAATALPAWQRPDAEAGRRDLDRYRRKRELAHAWESYLEAPNEPNVSRYMANES